MSAQYSAAATWTQLRSRSTRRVTGDGADRLQSAHASLRELLAQEFSPDLVVPTSRPRATNYQSVRDIPARYQMAWGIGVIDRSRDTA